MIYPHLAELIQLVEKKLVSKRPHPSLPLSIYNYTPAVMSLKIEEWGEALQDARGLILEEGTGEIVGRPFRKFWNYEQVLDKIPSDEPFTVAEKLDGSLGIVCGYHSQIVVATRGSFESEQAKWARQWLYENWFSFEPFHPAQDQTYLFEIIYPGNRIVVDYGPRESMVLLAVMKADGTEDLKAFEGAREFDKARSFPPSVISDQIQSLSKPNEEGYVVRWASGFRAKVKFEEYKRLHRLITQVSTRSIWELLRAGKTMDELLDSVPLDFKQWVSNTNLDLKFQFTDILAEAVGLFVAAPFKLGPRKDFALWATKQKYPNLLFAQLDQKPIEDMIWRMIEPKWATPFRKDIDS